MSQPVQDVQMNVDCGLDKESLRRCLICCSGVEPIRAQAGRFFGPSWKCTPERSREGEAVDQRRCTSGSKFEIDAKQQQVLQSYLEDIVTHDELRSHGTC